VTCLGPFYEIQYSGELLQELTNFIVNAIVVTPAILLL